MLKRIYPQHFADKSMTRLWMSKLPCQTCTLLCCRWLHSDCGHTLNLFCFISFMQGRQRLKACATNTIGLAFAHCRCSAVLLAESLVHRLESEVLACTWLMTVINARSLGEFRMGMLPALAR